MGIFSCFFKKKGDKTLIQPRQDKDVKPEGGCRGKQTAPAFGATASMISDQISPPHQRLIIGGKKWRDPREFLVGALKAEGRDPAEADQLLSNLADSCESQAVSALRIYEEIKGIYERLIIKGRRDIEDQMGGVCMNKAFVHEHLDDHSGAIREYELAIEILERLVTKKDRRELANDLADCYLKKGNNLGGLIRIQDSIVAYNRAIEILEGLVEKKWRRELAVEKKRRQELASDLAWCYWQKGLCYAAMIPIRQGAIISFDQAIRILERLVEREGRKELAGDLAWVQVSRAGALPAAGELARASAEMRQAVAILKEEVRRTGRAELKTALKQAKSLAEHYDL